jgi:hypothetical protein
MFVCLLSVCVCVCLFVCLSVRRGAHRSLWHSYSTKPSQVVVLCTFNESMNLLTYVIDECKLRADIPLFKRLPAPLVREAMQHLLSNRRHTYTPANRHDCAFITVTHSILPRFACVGAIFMIFLVCVCMSCIYLYKCVYVYVWYVCVWSGCK